MEPTPVIDIEQLLDAQELGGFNLLLLALSFLVMMTDGYDLGAAAFAAPGLIKEWGLRGPELGVLLSSSLAAGLFGPAIFGYCADRFGRRKTVIAGTLFFGAATIAAALVTSLNQLLVVRIIAGLALAGTMPIVVALNNEFAPKRLRATLVVVMFTGVTFGGGLPGIVAANFMAEHGWRLLFWIGGLVPLAIAVLLIALLPESLKFLALDPSRRTQLVARLRRIAPKLMIDDKTRFVIGNERNRERFSFSGLFEGRLALLTPLFWASNIIALMVFYFINQWMPTVLSDSGVTLQQVAIATTLFQFGGTLAGLLSMRFLDTKGFIPVPILYACAIPIVAAIGIPGLPQYVLIALVAAAGFCLLGLQFGNIASEANIYPTYIRSWGVGSNFAVGCIGGALGPLLGGYMFAAQLPKQQIFLIAAAPLVVGLIVAGAIVPFYKAQTRAPSSVKDATPVAP